MNCHLYIAQDLIGEVKLKVIDETMGALMGTLIAAEGYKKYEADIQRYYELQGIANMENFPFRLKLADQTELRPEGGIGVIDAIEFDEILVEIAGLDLSIVES